MNEQASVAGGAMPSATPNLVHRAELAWQAAQRPPSGSSSGASVAGGATPPL